MSLFGLFKPKPTSASKAKDRLSIMLAHERAENSFPFMEDMKNDIIEVIRKYMPADSISVHTQQNQNIDTIELEINLGK